MLNPEGRVIMISGANRGIGRAIAEKLAAAGYKLSLGARNPDSIIKPSANDSEIITHQWEATSTTDSTQWVDATLKHFGRIDGLVLNAGVIYPAGLEDGSEEDIDNMWAVNFKGPLRLVRAALPSLKSTGHGRVVNIVSLSGVRVMGAGNMGYCASKHASIALTHAIRQDGWASGLRATSICPGLVETDMVSNVQTPEGEFKITPEAVAATAAYALSLPAEAVVAEIRINSRLESLF